MKVGINPASIIPRRFAHAVLSFFHAVLSLLMRMDRPCILPRIPCHFEGGCGFCELAPTEFVCAARWGWHLFRYCVKNDFGKGFGHLGDNVGLAGKGRKIGDDLLNYSLLQSPSDLKFCRSRSRICFSVRTCLLGAKRPLTRTIAYTMLWCEFGLAGGGGWVHLHIIQARSVCLSG